MNMMLLALIFIVLGLLASFWMCKTLWPRNQVLAVACLVFFPLALIALVAYWKDPKADVRIPFGLALVAYVVAGILLLLGVEDVPRAETAAVPTRGLELSADNNPSPAPATDQSTAGFIPTDKVVVIPLPGPEVEAQQRRELEAAAQQIAWRFGTVDLNPAPARLEQPTDFRFALRSQAIRAARLRGTPLDNYVIGWSVHRNVDLARDDAWYVQLRYRAVAQMPRAPTMMGDKDNDAAVRADYARDLAGLLQGDAARSIHNATWDSTLNLASWEWQRENTGEARDYVVAVPMSNGVLELSVPALHPSQAELGQRAARLMAARISRTGNGAQPR